MKCLELIHEHHTVSSADHVMSQQDSGGAAWFHFLPHCPPPSLVSPALCATRRPGHDSAFCWQKKTQERDSEGSLTSLHAVSISSAKLGCLTSWLKHNRGIYPPDRVRPKVHGAQYPAPDRDQQQMLGGCVRMVQAYHKASPLPASSKLWLKTSCARDCIFVLNCPRWTSLPWICLIAFWTYLDFWHPQHPVAMNSSLIMSCMKKYFPFVKEITSLKKRKHQKKPPPKPSTSTYHYVRQVLVVL